MFYNACPRLVNPSAPDYASDANALTAMTMHQRKCFLGEVGIQLALPAVMSHLKLYMSIPVTKLGRFCNIDPETLKQNLVFIKARSSQLVRVSEGSAPIEGTRMVICDVNFFIAGDMISVVPALSKQSFARFFATNAL
jgi:hypothetical protein